jgi:NAD(P)-dependent dehydrogenase (short-subunit alcohol dehydrogenase family)
MDIAGKVFIVTGGASGLGEGTARMLAANGGKVVIADLQADKGEAWPRNSAASSSSATSARKPTARRPSPRRELGKLVGLVNCAGIAGGEDGRQGRRARAGAVRQGDHRQPGRQLQHDPPGRRGMARTSPKPPASAAC